MMSLNDWEDYNNLLSCVGINDEDLKKLDSNYL